MKRIIKLVIAVTVIITVLGDLNALAQPRRGGANRRYDPKTVETVEGTVLSVQKTAPPRDRGYGVHLTLQTADNSNLDVHLGPAWYLDKQSIGISAKDVITVTGSRVTIDGKPALIAAEIKKGAEVLKLRNQDGTPAWGGGRRNR